MKHHKITRTFQGHSCTYKPLNHHTNSHQTKTQTTRNSPRTHKTVHSGHVPSEVAAARISEQRLPRQPCSDDTSSRATSTAASLLPPNCMAAVSTARNAHARNDASAVYISCCARCTGGGCEGGCRRCRTPLLRKDVKKPRDNRSRARCTQCAVLPDVIYVCKRRDITFLFAIRAQVVCHHANNV